MAAPFCAGWLEKALPALSMVFVQILITVMTMLSKLVLSQGMSPWTLLMYRNAIGALAAAPLAIFFESRENRKKLGLLPFLFILLNASTGTTMLLATYFYGLRDTTASYSSNFLNIIPIITFLLSVIARLENLGLSSNAGKAKVFGAFVCIGGAMVVTLYKGIHFHLRPSLVSPTSSLVLISNGKNWLRGTLLLVCSCLSAAIWYLVQAKLFQVYPFIYMSTTLTCAVGCAQACVIGVIVDRRASTWRLGWDLRLLTVVYTGIFNSAASLGMTTWVVSQCGPTYPSMFSPLSLLFTTTIGFLCLGQDLTMGSLLGFVLIVGGLYTFLWGKRKEMQAMPTCASTSSVGLNPDQKKDIDVTDKEHIERKDSTVPMVQ